MTSTLAARNGAGHSWAGLIPPYSTIVIDPPWPYNGEMPINRGSRTGQTMRFLPYSPMLLGEIRELPVRRLTSPGGHLYLWTTNRYLEDAFGIVRAWGFDPVTTLVWCKAPVGHGLGGRFAITTEFVLFAREPTRAGILVRQAREAAGLSRGDLHRLVRDNDPTGIVYRWEADDCLPTEDDWTRLQAALPALVGVPRPEIAPSELAKVDTTWWQWKRGPHSTKPPAFLDVVEQISPGPYVELFARQPRLGWDSWGWGYE